MASDTSVNLKQAEELANALSEAISGGDRDEAVSLSHRLSELDVPVTISINSQAYPKDSIRIKVGVEDGQSDASIPLVVEVTSDMKIAQLKDKFSHDYGFHPSLQRWVIGKRLARDQDTLYCHGIRETGDQAFLFLLSAHAAQLTRHQQQLDEEQQCLESIVESVYLIPRGLGPLVMKDPLLKLPKPLLLPKPKLGWSCGQCTYKNKPTRPGCEICGAERPVDYRVPEAYKPDQEEVLRMKKEDQANQLYQQVLEAEAEKRARNFQDLLETDGHSLVPNITALDCPICFGTLQPGEGVMLRECLHCFCRDCLKGTIVNSQDAEVSCPFMDEYSCDRKLLDREIQSLLTDEEHQRFLALRLSIAESRVKNSFHCQTLNCHGWCIYEDEVDEFHCDLCNATNCILCKAIHNGMNCKEYQDDLRLRAENDLAAKQTKDMLEGMLQNGEAMKCPCCDVIVQKKDGCDWICCLMCKTEICWVTKQARWGPNGRGDMSGGCKCRVNNQLCHPKCQNCH